MRVRGGVRQVHDHHFGPNAGCWRCRRIEPRDRRAPRRRYDEGSGFNDGDTLSLAIVTPEGRGALLRRRAVLRSKRQGLSERLAALNLDERVEVDAATVAAL